MTNANLINATKANRLYWLGRYQERVYLTLHLLRRCYDKMIDGNPEQYSLLWKKLDPEGNYASTGAFTLGMMYDEENPDSLIWSLNCAMDNAIMLRDDLKSETTCYIEMSIAALKRFREEGMREVPNLQPLTDWALAFWGSISHRVSDPKVKSLLALGENVEQMAIYLRFNYPMDRIEDRLYVLEHWAEEMPEIIDKYALEAFKEVLESEKRQSRFRDPQVGETIRYQLTDLLCQIVKV